MIRVCTWLYPRQNLPPRLLLSTSAPICSSKQSVESKLGIPEKPKRPLTPFLRYLSKIRVSLQQKHPEANVKEIAKIAAQHWAQVSASERAQLGEEFKNDSAAYAELLSKYNERLSPEQRHAVALMEEEAREMKERKDMRKKLKDLGRPKKPPSAFLLFLKDRSSSRVPSEDYKAFQRRIAEEWTALGDRRSPYMEAGARALEAYNKDLTEWEERMIKQGFTNLVRGFREAVPLPPTSVKKHN